MNAPHIEIKGNGATAHIYIDGVDVADKITGYTLTHKGGTMPTLQLDIPALDVSVDAEILPVMPEPWRSLWGKEETTA